MGANYSKRDGAPYEGDEVLISELVSRAKSEGEEKKSEEVGEQVRVESDASWGEEVDDWQSYTYTVTCGDGRICQRSVRRNLESSLSRKGDKGSRSE